MGFLLDELNAYHDGLRASEASSYMGGFISKEQEKKDKQEQQKNQKIFKEFELVIKNPENIIEFIPRETVADPYCPDKNMSLFSTYKIKEKKSNKLIFQISYILAEPNYVLLPRIEGFYFGNYTKAMRDIFYCANKEYKKREPQRCVEDGNTVHNFLKQYQIADNKQK